MKKILIATDNFYPRIDGISRFLYEIVSRLSDDFQITVVCPWFPGILPEIDDVNVVRMPLSSHTAGDLPLAKVDKEVMKKHILANDLVWCQTIGPVGMQAIRMARKYDKVLVSYNHSIEWELFSHGLHTERLKWITMFLTKIYMRWLYNKFDLLLTPSIEIGEIFRKNGIRVPFKPIYLGVDADKFLPVKDKMKAKEAIGVERNCFIIGYHGRLGREKDLKTLYRGFIRAKREIPNLRLMIVGSGVAEYEELFKNKNSIYFMGSQNNVIPFLQAMDAYVLTSKTETTSLATLEAMSIGLPVIVTPVGHIQEYISDEKNGLVFPIGDAYALSRQIKKIYEDENLRHKLSGNARKTIQEMYSWDKTVKDIKEVFENI